MVTFASIDFETATGDQSSACALGLILVDDGAVIAGYDWLIRPPENAYDEFNIDFHGISPNQTADSPCFNEVWSQASALIGDRLVVAHNTAFDMFVLQHAAAYWGYALPSMRFACTYRLAREVWPDRDSHKLNHLAEHFGIALDHHNALSDANAAAELGLRISAAHGNVSLERVAAIYGFCLGKLLPDGYTAFSNNRGSVEGSDYHS